MEHLDGLERSDFCDFENHTSGLIRKESPASKARRKANQKAFVKKGGMPDRVKILGEIDRSKKRPRVRPGFVKPIRNGLRKEQNLIKSRPFWAETGLARRENGVRFQKEE